MNIDFQNFGAIKSGEMRLAPLTLLCGANNTSKTYALYAIYGLLKKTAFWNFSEWESLHLNDEGATTIALDEFLTKHWTKLQNDIGAQFTESLPSFFVTGKDSFADTRINFRGDLEATLEAARKSSFIHGLVSPREHDGLQINKEVDSFDLFVSYNNYDGSKRGVQTSRDRDFSRVFTEMILGFILQPNRFGGNDDVFLLPAERGGLNLFYSEISARRTARSHPTFRQSIEPDSSRSRAVSFYPLPLADYIDFLNVTYRLTTLNTPTPFADLALALQKEIVGGNYAVKRDGSIFFKPRLVKQSLGLHLSSSTAKTYFGLWFYLRYMAEEGDVLMIDEPELNLHPDNQRRIARVFARLINRGIRIVLSTHSDYLVRELNNLIILSNDFPQRDKVRAKYGYNQTDFIKPKDVRAYCFAGNTIAEMEISPDEGILAETFDKVINELNNSSYELSSLWAEHREAEAVKDADNS